MPRQVPAQSATPDNGRGHNPDQPKEGKGLGNMKKRIDRIDGTICFGSREPKGFVVRLEIKIPQNEG
jgi:signal transduction histidine kinase